MSREKLPVSSNPTSLPSSRMFNSYDSNTIHFPVKVDKDGEQVITYTVRYTW